MTEITSLRKKYVNSSLANKTCSTCHKEYPRTSKFFYARKHHSLKNVLKFDNLCVTCRLKINSKWKKNNKEYAILDSHRYKSTEIGYFKELWSSIKNASCGCDFKNFDEFFNTWKEQEKIYGMKCPYTGIEMTRIKGINYKKKKHERTLTNISRDRILSFRPYSKENMMFVCWEINCQKGNISPKIAKQYLQFVKERFGNDEMEF